jgi:predicted RNA binding protein YcfA (HicA-like mRNA interferase family)
MTKRQKLIHKIFEDRDVSYTDAEKILFWLGFNIDITGSHHIFRKDGYQKNISIKRRSQLKPYQVEMLKEILKDHGY